MTLDEIIKKLKKESDPGNLEGMARVGIKPENAFGTKLPVIRALAKEIGRNHALARELWKAGYRETRILAAMVEEPGRVTEKQMDRWLRDFTYWEICDQVCMNLFYLLPWAHGKAIEWCRLEEEQQRRAGFALMAVIAWKDKKAPDSALIEFLPHLKKGAFDSRGPVKKAVSWALRQTAKRNNKLKNEALKISRELARADSKHAKWVAKDVIRKIN